VIVDELCKQEKIKKVGSIHSSAEPIHYDGSDPFILGTNPTMAIRGDN